MFISRRAWNAVLNALNTPSACYAIPVQLFMAAPYRTILFVLIVRVTGDIIWVYGRKPLQYGAQLYSLGSNHFIITIFAFLVTLFQLFSHKNLYDHHSDVQESVAYSNNVAKRLHHCHLFSATGCGVFYLLNISLRSPFWSKIK